MLSILDVIKWGTWSHWSRRIDIIASAAIKAAHSVIQLLCTRAGKYYWEVTSKIGVRTWVHWLIIHVSERDLLETAGPPNISHPGYSWFPGTVNCISEVKVAWALSKEALPARIVAKTANVKVFLFDKFVIGIFFLPCRELNWFKRRLSTQIVDKRSV